MLEKQVTGGLDRLGPGATLITLESSAERTLSLDTYLENDHEPGVVPFIDLALQQRLIRARIEDGLFGVLAHGRYIGGPEIDALEARLADFIGVRHAIAVSNGTDALLIALMAAGVKAGDEVVTSPFTFAATGEMILLLGARPVYVDIDPQTYNLDVGKLAGALGERTRVILPVSIFGQCADMDEINAIARERGIKVIEDAAQSFGATYKERRSGSLCDIGCTSFFPSKPLGGYGDSGACFTDDDELAGAIRQIRDHGQDGRYHHARLGVNGRMSSFQASVLLAKLSLFEEEVRLRMEAGVRYDRLFEAYGRHGGSDEIVTPVVRPYNRSVYAQYSLLAPQRDKVQAELRTRGIPTAVHYPVPLNNQPAMRDEECRAPVAADVSARVISIPMHPYIRESEQVRVVKEFCTVVDGLHREA
ncbi:MAG: DegT/DnrJ/EryC1/StrS family aminotransferase [Proteobacteria bacterium]|nr:MAG: DegT/DnrJ/EryC1/StrS family aminotransferase [Pseudomonadota bacterium]